MNEAAEKMDVTLYGGAADGEMIDGIPEDKEVILHPVGNEMWAYRCSGRTTRRKGKRRVIFRSLGRMGLLGWVLAVHIVKRERGQES